MSRHRSVHLQIWLLCVILSLPAWLSCLPWKIRRLRTKGRLGYARPPKSDTEIRDVVQEQAGLSGSGQTSKTVPGGGRRFSNRFSEVWTLPERSLRAAQRREKFRSEQEASLAVKARTLAPRAEPLSPLRKAQCHSVQSPVQDKPEAGSD